MEYVAIVLFPYIEQRELDFIWGPLERLRWNKMTLREAFSQTVIRFNRAFMPDDFRMIIGYQENSTVCNL